MTIYGRSEELVSRCIECDLAEPESLASLGGSAPGVVDGILSQSDGQDSHLSRTSSVGGPVGVHITWFHRTAQGNPLSTRVQVRHRICQSIFYTFVYLQKRVTSQETVMAKHAFERSAEQRGIMIKHYHTDKGHFTDNAFIQDCQANKQNLLYCGVNAHFQNGIAERRIRDLQE